MHSTDRNAVIFGYADLNYLLVLLRESAVLLSTKIEVFKHKEPDIHSKYMDFVNTLESAIKTFEIFTNSSDEAIALMTPEQRKCLEKEAPGFFYLLGWRNRIDDKGSIIHNA